MKLIRDIGSYRSDRDSVVCIGVFDGVHKAHRRIISAAVKRARRIKAISLVLTFWPHPQKQASVYSLAHRLSLIRGMGVDVCAVIRFDRGFAGISAGDFVRDILVKRLRAAEVFVGENFRFGKNALGDVALLKKLSRCAGFRVRTFPVYRSGRKAVSSTLIRRLITEGKLKSAQRLLLRPVSVLGTVVKGSSLGRELGFPTANIDPHHEILPPSGIYAVRVVLGKKIYSGVCYIGKRPTFHSQEQSIEVHILDFRKNIYAKNLEILFLRRIRPDKKFPDKEALIKQIKKDINQAGKILSRP